MCQQRVELARAPHGRPLDPAPAQEDLRQVDSRRLAGRVAEADEDAAAGGEVVPTPGAVLRLLPDAPATWVEHDELRVDGVPVDWWVEGSGSEAVVHATQLAALAKLAERGPMSQNQLGRVTAMDAATIKGVVGRLVTRRLVTTVPSEEDRRRLVVDLTPEGRALFAELGARGGEATERTLAPLSAGERERFLDMLRRLT